MKKILILITVFLLIGVNLYAGDLIVDGNVRIGPLDPLSKLDVSGAGGIAIRQDVDVNSQIDGLGLGTSTTGGVSSTIQVVSRHATNGAADLRFTVWDGSQTIEGLRFTNNGNVGIGTTDPGSYRLNAAGKIYSTLGFLTDNNQQIGWRNSENTANNDWILTNSNIMQYRSGGTPLFLITDSGNVGIGTTNNLEGKLHVVGNQALFANAETNYRAIFIQGDHGNGVSIIGATSGGSLGRGDLAIYTGDTEKIRVTVDGNVGIGTDNPGAYKLNVVGQIKGDELCIGTDCRNAWPSSVPSQWITSGSDIYYNSGNVGIGTTNPEFKLALDNDGGILAKGTYNSGAILSTAGAGARLIWYPRKAAFRAGRVTGTQWDEGNIGNDSLAVGYNPKASGNYSIALGATATASGNSAIAISGDTSTVSGANGVLIGFGNVYAPYGVGIGWGPTVGSSGSAAVAIGYYPVANGAYSVALGNYVNTSSTSNNSVVIGNGVNTNNRLVNNIAGSIMFGTNSTVPTVFISQGSGVGTTGKVGIGTTTPAVKLDVAGAVKIADTLSDCDSAHEGTIKYVSSHFYGCTDTGWKQLDNL